MTQPAQVIPGTTPRQWPPTQGSDDVRSVDVSAPPQTPEDRVRIADFSYTPPKLQFTMDGETYECYPVISAAIAQDITQLSQDGFFARDAEVTANNAGEAMHKIAAVFKVVIKPGSFERFIERLMSRDEPLDINKQIIPLLQWLLEQYGARPTVSVSDSSRSSPNDPTGTHLTDGAPDEESTQHS